MCVVVNQAVNKREGQHACSSMEPSSALCHDDIRDTYCMTQPHQHTQHACLPARLLMYTLYTSMCALHLKVKNKCREQNDNVSFENIYSLVITHTR